MNEKREQATTQWGSSFDGTKFFMVYAEGKEAPVRKHLRLGDAKAEARRISEKEGVKCYILESCEEVEKPIKVDVIKQAKLYWYEVTDNPKVNDALFAKLKELSGGDIPEDKECIRYFPHDIIYNKGKDFMVSKYCCDANDIARSAYNAIKLFGTELRVKEE